MENKPEEHSPAIDLSIMIGRWKVTQNNLKWIFVLSGIALLILFLGSLFFDKSNWTGNLIGIIGGLASLFGIYLTLLQVIETKKDVAGIAAVTQATKNATDSTIKTIQKTLSIAQVVKYCQQIKLIQEKLSNKELKIVIHLTHELREAVIELESYLKSIDVNFNDKVISSHVKRMGANITYIRTAIEQNNENYKQPEILKDFDDLLKTMSEIKAQLTTFKNDRQKSAV